MPPTAIVFISPDELLWGRRRRRRRRRDDDDRTFELENKAWHFEYGEHLLIVNPV